MKKIYIVCLLSLNGMLAAISIENQTDQQAFMSNTQANVLDGLREIPTIINTKILVPPRSSYETQAPYAQFQLDHNQQTYQISIKDPHKAAYLTIAPDGSVMGSDNLIIMREKKDPIDKKPIGPRLF